MSHEDVNDFLGKSGETVGRKKLGGEYLEDLSDLNKANMLLLIHAIIRLQRNLQEDVQVTAVALLFLPTDSAVRGVNQDVHYGITCHPI